MRFSLAMEFHLGRENDSMSKDWLQKHSESLRAQRAEEEYQWSKDAELRAKAPLVWAEIRKQVAADVERLNAIRGDQGVQYTPSMKAFELKRQNYPTVTATVTFPDPHVVSYEINSRFSSDAPRIDAHGQFAFKVDRAGNVCIYHKGKLLEDEGSVSEILLTPFLST
jgi:hypothetical protein